MNLKVVAIIIVAIIGVIGIGILTSDSETSNGDTTVSANTYGTSPGNITITEAGDFECPACASFYPIVKEIKEKYKDQVVFEYKHFPLTAIHQNAFAAHRAAQAAALQGKFWEMHDLLFEQRSLWIGSSTTEPIPQLDAFAEQLSLDMEKFKADFASEAVNNIIQSDASSMRSLGASSTPTFFINGELVDNGQLSSIELFSAVIDRKLADAGQPPVTGDTPVTTEPTDQ